MAKEIVAADPLVELEKIVKRCNASVVAATPPISVYVSSGSWTKRVATVEVRYDARKTDSLVAPIVGQIDITIITATNRAEDEAAAKALDFTTETSASAVRNRYKLEFVWRDGKWFLKEGTNVLDFRKSAGTYGGGVVSNVDGSKPPEYYYTGVGHCFP